MNTCVPKPKPRRLEIKDSRLSDGKKTAALGFCCRVIPIKIKSGLKMIELSHRLSYSEGFMTKK